MKPIADWNEMDVLALPRGEHDWVEFKGSRALDFSLPGVKEGVVLDEMSKQVAAFANSGGGTLVYGVSETGPTGARVVDMGGIRLALRGRSTKEWLEDVIPNLVDYPLSRLNVYVIGGVGPATQITPDHGLVVIEVPDSESAPHQARDKCYYARVAGKSRPVGHRLVQDMFSRTRHPTLDLHLSLHERGASILLQAFCSNSGRVYANYVNGFLEIPIEICRSPSDDDPIDLIQHDGQAYKYVSFSNIHKDMVAYKPGDVSTFGGTPGEPYYVTRYDPVLPKLGFELSEELGVTAADLIRFADLEVHWAIYADNAPAACGQMRIGEVERVAPVPWPAQHLPQPGSG
jgi:hypothetical protein